MLYCLLGAWACPWFWLEAVEQHRLVTSRDMEDAPHHFAMYALTNRIFAGCVPVAIAAVAMSIFVWRVSSRGARTGIVAWFGLLSVLAIFMGLGPAMFGSSYATVPARIVLGWIDLGLEGVLMLLPLVFLVVSLSTRTKLSSRL